MPLSFDHDRLRVPSGVVTRVVDGATVLLNASTGRYFTLDEIGSRAWALLTSSSSIQQAYEALLLEYAAEPEQVRRDLETLIDSLTARGLLEVHRV
jgi:Coenzyme PQQ synthesis protein D (PqqD)